MFRGIVKAMVMALGLMAAAPLSAQQPGNRPPQGEWTARQGQGRRMGPRRRKMRRHHRRAAFMRMQRTQRMHAWRTQRGFGRI